MKLVLKQTMILSFGLLLFLKATPAVCQLPFWQQTGGPEATYVVEMFVDGNGDLFAGTIGDGIFKSTNSGENWNQVNNGLTSFDILALARSEEGRLFAGTSQGELYHSDDNGDSWTSMTAPGDAGIFAIAAVSSGVIFVGGDGGIYRSTDGGTSWERLESGLPHIIMIRAFVLLPNDDLIAGSYGMGTFRTTDNGDTWIQTFPGSPDNSAYSFTVDASGTIFAATTLGIYSSTDAGGTWFEMEDPAGANVLDFVIDSTDAYFAATTTSIYYSTDHGNNWAEARSGLGDLSVLTLGVDEAGVVYAGTNGDGVYKAVMATEVRHTEEGPRGFSVEQNYPNPFNPVTNFQFTIANSQLTILRVYDLLGREVATVVDEKLEPGTYTRRWDAGGMSSGVYYYRLWVRDFVETRKMLLLR